MICLFPYSCYAWYNAPLLFFVYSYDTNMDFLVQDILDMYVCYVVTEDSALICRPFCWRRCGPCDTNHVVDHDLTGAHIICRIANTTQGFVIETGGDVGQRAEDVEEGAFCVDGLAAGLVDEIVGGLAAKVRREAHHDGLADDEAVGAADQVVEHSVRVDDQAAQGECGLVQGPSGQDEGGGMAAHSRCQGPEARSKSVIMASRPRAAWLRSSLEAAKMTSAEMGLRFWGMVEEAPRWETNGSDSSPNSLEAMMRMS